MTSLHIVLGELAPKSLALQRPEGTAIFVVQLLELYLAIFRPVIHFLNNLGNFVLKLMGLEAGGSEELIHSPEEIRLLVAASRQAGVVGEIQEDVIERVFDIEERRISAFMTPRRAIVWLDIEDPIPVLQKTVIESVHSHFPVCHGSIDELIGFITAKQLLAASLDSSLTIEKLAKLLNPPLYIPESSRVAPALEQFKSSGNHTAVIVDEYGAIQGLVTLNDILEAIVGDIRTGNEPEEPKVIQRSDGSWLIDGMLSVEDFKDLFNIKDLPGEEGVEYQTVGGFVLSQLGHLPTVSESFEWDRLYVEVVDMDEHRVDKVLVRLLPTEDEE
jgi:putative hemolysin